MTRRLLFVLGMLATTFALAAQAQQRLPVKINPRDKSAAKPSEDKTDPKIKIADAATQQERLKNLFDDFRLRLLRLAQKMENSTKPEDRDKAKILRQAIQKASAEGVETRFSSLIEMLKGGNASNNTEKLNEILTENQELRRILLDIIELLKKDDRDAELKRQIAETRRLLEELKNVIRKQELVLNKTILPRTPNKDLAKSQNRVREQTHDLVNPKSSQGKQTKKGEGKGNKSGQKGQGEAKDDTKGPKANAKESKDGKSGEGKEGKEGKQSEGKQGQAKQGEGKSGKPGEGKEGKPGEGKSGKPSDGKSGQSKPGASKSSDSKSKGEGKSDSKGSAGKSGQSGQGKQSQGKPGQSGQSGQSGKQGQAKSGGNNKSGQQQQQQQPSQEQSQIKKQIEDAQKYQERAEDNLRKDNRKDAPDEEQAALDKLNQAKKALEDLLRQLREEEIERLLARLEARCRLMLKMQMAVRDDTDALDKVIKTTDAKDTLTTRANQAASLQLSDREEEIVKEARAGLALLEEEGSAVAFAEVFSQVKGDMETVATRLRKTDTGVVTIAIEDQIIDTLKEMIEALKKAQADNKKKSQGGGGGMPPPDRLLDLLAELKMIRSMQKRVNARTDLYGKQYAGEQAPPPEQGKNSEEREHYQLIQTELKDLSKRQKKISKVTHDIATGKNEQK